MKIVAIADTHMIKPLQYMDLPAGDVLVIAGDLLNIGGHFGFKRIMNQLLKIKDNYKHIIIVAGNHDFAFTNYLNRIILAEKDIIYLEDEEIIIDGVKFYGTPWTRPFNDWAFMAEDKRRKIKFANIPKDLDVLITHSPPFEILDKNDEGKNLGCKILKGMIEKGKIKPKYHIFGHIHSGIFSEKIRKYKNTTFCNASLVDEGYSLVNRPIVLEVGK